jgi:hypothetical protein
MAGKSPVKASEQQRTALEALAASRERGEADRARAMLLTLNGWTSARIAEAFGVREGFRWRRPRHTLKGRQNANEISRVGLRLKLRRLQAEAAILCCFTPMKAKR